MDCYSRTLQLDFKEIILKILTASEALKALANGKKIMSNYLSDNFAEMDKIQVKIRDDYFLEINY